MRLGHDAHRSPSGRRGMGILMTAEFDEFRVQIAFALHGRTARMVLLCGAEDITADTPLESESRSTAPSMKYDDSMKTLKTLLLAASAAMLAFSFGCSTPETRIRKNPELFAQLAPEQQDLIRRGQVAVGFNAEMVRLALGEPDRYTTRTDQDGMSEVWHYVTYDAPEGRPS